MKKRKIKLGVAMISALTLGGLIMTGCGDQIIDVEPVENILLIRGYESTSINLTDTITLTAVDGQNNPVEGVSWSSSNTSVLYVDSSSGTLIPRNLGSATITCTKDGYVSDSVSFTVINPSLESISVTANGSTELKVNETVTLVASASSNLASVSWSSSNPSIASVTNAGLVTARGLGTVRITASADGYNPGYIDITVVEGEAAPTQYTITYRQATGVTINYTTTSAVSGDTIEFSVEVTNDAVMIDRVTMNDEVISPTSGNNYSFTMPASDVVIRVYTTVDPDIDTDVVVIGESTIPLILNSATGIYEAHGVSLENTTQLAFYVRENGDFVKKNYQDFDFYKCFADVENASDYHTYSFKLPGGFTYSFYYDTNAELRPCYVIRTNVDVLPSSTTSFDSLFDGGKSQQSLYPRNVKTVNYTNSATDEAYSFTRYANNTSIANVTNASGTLGKGVVYKSINNGVYKKIDTYVESTNDPTKLYDSTPYSAQIKVFDTLAEVEESPYRDWDYDDSYSYMGTETSRREAEFDANHYSHDMNSIEFDIMYAYRVGYAADELQSSSINITSTNNNNGTFTTIIDSRKTLVDASKNLYEHYEYDVSITFNNDGSILNGTYLEKVYGTTDYNFASESEGFLTGGEARGSVVKELTFAYTYSETLDAAAAFDTTPYFISSISNLRINNDSVNTDASKNVLKKNDIIEQGTNLTFDFAPTTALDSWQYYVTNSSDETVIGTPNSSYEYRALQNGTSTLTLSNRTVGASGTSATVDVSVMSNPARSVYFDSTYTGRTEDLADGYESAADYVYVYAGRESKVTMRSSPSGTDNVGFVFTPSDENLKIGYDPVNELMTIDATAITVTEVTRITIEITGGNWEDGINGDTLYVYLVPSSGLTIPAMVGDWKVSGDQPDLVTSSSSMNVNLTSIEHEYNGSTWYDGTFTNGTTSVAFIYRLSAAGIPEARSVSDNYSVRMTYEVSTSRLGLIIYTSSWAGEDSTTTTYLAGGDDGDEDYTTYYYTYFAKEVA